MPILFEKDPLEVLMTEQDPGLEYLEWQKSWRQRTHWDIQPALQFVNAQSRGEEPACRPKSFDHTEQIFLDIYDPQADYIRRPMMSDVLFERKTRRDHDIQGSISLKQLGALLQIGYGSKWPPGLERFSPSPGGLYTLEIYVWWPGSADLDQGIFHYHPQRHVLERFHILPPTYSIEDLLLPEAVNGIRKGCGCIFVSSVIGLMRRKYGPKYLRFCMLEAGIALQSFYMAGSHLGVGVWPQGYFFEDELNQLLLIDGRREAALTGFVFGAENGKGL